jgi:hypothetical protein
MVRSGLKPTREEVPFGTTEEGVQKLETAATTVEERLFGGQSTPRGVSEAFIRCDRVPLPFQFFNGLQNPNGRSC